ncbi:MAG TPA: potassium-transporting ATPase subunit KdpC [Smithellaceae bacterium]|nr:potassium-transporting ATPase subunit KdpC [Smithellaceae bacterium]
MFQWKRSLLMFCGLSLICGLIYPLIITLTANIFFPEKAKGSIIKSGGQAVGSYLIGQQFTSPRYFHGRPSATDPVYDAGNSGGSNLAPSNAKLIAQASGQVQSIRMENDLTAGAAIPAELVLASASGLDPHISPAAAYMQAERVARERSIERSEVEKLIKDNTEEPFLWIWGKERVNILILNLALDGWKK